MILSDLINYLNKYLDCYFLFESFIYKFDQHSILFYYILKEHYSDYFIINKHILEFSLTVSNNNKKN